MPGADRLFPDEDFVYIVEDNSPIHTARIVREWYAAHPRLQRLQWPAKSPDLNIIENVWAEMCRKWGPCPAVTVQGLKRVVARSWHLLRRRPLYFENLLNSMSNRLAVVLESGGYQTKY